MRAARGSCPNDEVMCQCMPIFQAKGPKIWTWRTLHVEKPADESVDLWIREIKTHGEICWKLIWIIIILDIFRQEHGSKKRDISQYIKH